MPSHLRSAKDEPEGPSVPRDVGHRAPHGAMGYGHSPLAEKGPMGFRLKPDLIPREAQRYSSLGSMELGEGSSVSASFAW